ncbi:hypothetical protein, partial [Bacteroides nordii]|uniref:hypothetical protein n=1 Tax=Bacteroides nordii TaxID=291645 RepID=UPI002A7FB11C
SSVIPVELSNVPLEIPVLKAIDCSFHILVLYYCFYSFQYEKSTKGASYDSEPHTKTLFKPFTSIWWVGIFTCVRPKSNYSGFNQPAFFYFY